eukprot:353763-Chlamydomonas_euryale.AAC.2
MPGPARRGRLCKGLQGAAAKYRGCGQDRHGAGRKRKERAEERARDCHPVDAFAPARNAGLPLPD